MPSGSVLCPLSVKSKNFLYTSSVFPVFTSQLGYTALNLRLSSTKRFSLYNPTTLQLCLYKHSISKDIALHPLGSKFYFYQPVG